MRRILVINLNFLGDVLFTTPALTALGRRFPGAQLDVFLSERAAPILWNHPGVSQLLLRPAAGGSKARWKALARVLRDGRYDAVVVFHGTALSGLFVRLHGVPIRLGFDTERAGWLFTEKARAHQPGEHFAEAFLRAVGGGDGTEHLQVYLTDTERSAVALPEGRCVGLAIGTTRPQKTWPVGHFAQLAKRLRQAGLTPVLLGGAAEAEAAAAIPDAVSLVGKTDLRGLLATIERLDALVTGDTGPLHFAVALGTPTVALFGSTDPRETGPWRPTAPTTVLYDALPCAPCRKRPICEGRHDCLVGITPERVFQAVREVLT